MTKHEHAVLAADENSVCLCRVSKKTKNRFSQFWHKYVPSHERIYRRVEL